MKEEDIPCACMKYDLTVPLLSTDSTNTFCS